MKERIRELALQAGYTPVPGFDFANSMEEVFIKKFAELLIKECAEVADNADATREKWQSIGKFVKEHFGVEE